MTHSSCFTLNVRLLLSLMPVTLSIQPVSNSSIIITHLKGLHSQDSSQPSTETHWHPDHPASASSWTLPQVTIKDTILDFPPYYSHPFACEIKTAWTRILSTEATGDSLTRRLSTRISFHLRGPWLLPGLLIPLPAKRNPLVLWFLLAGR